MPKVSVLTPIYNTNPEFLKECIESILNQTFKDFEFLILNDSPDNIEIEKVVKSYDDKRIKYIKNEKNLGISESRNKLLSLAQGEYLAIFDHDDISMPDRLEVEVKYLDANPEIGAVSGWLELFDKKTEIWYTPEFDIDIKKIMTEDCSFFHTAAMIRRNILINNNIKYEPYYTPAEDYRLWARLMNVTKFYNFQRPLVKYRWFENNTTNLQAEKMSRAHDAIQIDIINEFPAYRWAFLQMKNQQTIFRLRLFNLIPILKIKNNWVLLFEFIPVFKIKWK